METAGKKLSMESFHIMEVVGRGAYGEVVLAKNKANGEMCAIKILEKSYLAKEKKQYQVFIEKEVLSSMTSPSVVKLLGSFHDNQYLYFVLEFCEGGELASYLKHNFKFLKALTVQFYIAEIVLILEDLHSSGIIHRDLKPENLMLTKENHLKIIDFGTCGFDKRISKSLFERINGIKTKFSSETSPIDEDDEASRNRASTFVGTAEYVSPELLEGEVCTAASDLWALGCIIYRMFVGHTPFIDPNDVNEFKVFNQVKACAFSIPKIVPADAGHLITLLLKRSPIDRLGAGETGSGNDYKHLKQHRFFEGVNWQTLRTSKAPERTVKHETEVDDAHISIGDENNNTTQESNETLGFTRPIFTGKVLKKVAWMIYKSRYMVLIDDPPKLMYFDGSTNEKKGEIPLSKSTVIEFKDKQSFNVLGARKTYFFKEQDHPANLWVEKIQKVISKLNN